MASATFSALVQTKSIESVLSPIAAQVSNLIILHDASVKDQNAFPDLVSSAEHIFKKVHTLTSTGFKLAQESSDKILQCDMPSACKQVLEAGNHLLTAAQQLRIEPQNLAMRSVLVESARKVLEYTVNVLLTTDDAEVRKIIQTTNAVMESLWILQNVTTWDDFRRHFQGFNDLFQKLLFLCEKRRKELVNLSKQEVIASSTKVLINSLSMFWSSSQEFLQLEQRQVKARRDYIVGQILLACSEIINTVETKPKEKTPPSHSPQHSIEQQKLPPADQNAVGSLTSRDDLDYYLDAIIRNSLAVADKCEHQKRKLRIAKACQEVLETRGKLNTAQEAIIANPSSERYRQEFDFQTDKLQQCLHYLDRRVTMEIIAGVCIVFADVDCPLQNLITAATSPVVDGSLLNYNQAMSRLKQGQQTFLDHSGKLCHAANQASSIAAEPDRVHAIRSSIAQLERITPQIISTTSELRQSPQNTTVSQRLKIVQQEWRTHAGVLSDLSMSAVSPGDFLSTTEALAKESVTKCQESLSRQDLEQLTRELSVLVGISEKAIIVCKNELHRTADPLFKSRLTEVTLTVNSILPEVASLSTDLICNIQDTSLHHQFFERASRLTEKLGEMRSIVKRSPVHLKDNSFEDVDVKAIIAPIINVTQNPSAVVGMVNHDQPVTRYQSTVSVVESTQGRASPVMRSDSSNSLPVQKMALSRSRRNRNSRDIENYISETRLCLLLGLSLVEAEDIQMLKKVSSLLRGCPASLMSRLVDAVSQSDYALVERRCNDLSRRAASLKDFVDEPALRRTKNKDASNLAINTSLEVYESTADVVQLAWKVAANPTDTKAEVQLQAKCDEWSEKLDVVRATVDKLVNPWSVSASLVVQAITLNDQNLLAKKISNLREHVLRMRELASAAKAAADAEDAVDVCVEGEPPARNPDSLRRIELVMVKSAEVDELTKRFINVCQERLKNREKPLDLDNLEYLRRDWACKVQSLIYAVDDITAGTSAPVDGLGAAAFLRDGQTVRDRGKLLNTYILTLKDMANGCSADCRDKEKADKSQETVACVDKLTQEFQDAVAVVQQKGQSEASTVENSLLFMSCVEKMVLLQREWSVKVHLFTSLIDDMTADVSAHVDRLAGAALQVSRVDRSLKLEHLRDFEAQSNKLSSKVARVRNHACLTISKCEDNTRVQMVRVTCDFLDRLTPQVIAAARGLADNPDQPTVEHFQMLRRQWASKAHLLMATLQSFKNVQYSSIEVVTRELLASIDNDQNDPHILSVSGHFHPEPLLSNRGAFTSPASSNSPANRPSRAMHAGMQASGGDMRARPRRAKERVDDLESSLKEIGGLVETMSDLAMRREDAKTSTRASSSRQPGFTPSLRGHRGSGSDSNILRTSFFSAPLIASSESLNEGDLRKRSWSPAVLRRAASADVVNKPWRSESLEDLWSKKSSRSIARAAAQLRDEADKWEDENNNFVRVAKNLARQMFAMAEMARKRPRHRDKSAMIETAKNIASECQVVWQFANIIARHCIEQTSCDEILHSAGSIPTLGTQLSIIASVKSATPDDRSAESVLVGNAQNLMEAVVNTLRVIEGASIKGVHAASSASPADAEATDVIFEWKRKLRRQRSVEALVAERGGLGLRMRDSNTPDPSLVDILHI